MGLGRFGGGVGVARYCAARGARVLVTDLLDADALKPSVDRLADLDVELRLGRHDPVDFATADCVVVNPAVDRRNNRYLHAAEQHGATITTEIELFIQVACCGPHRKRTIGVTGSVGKSTTVAMIGHALGRIAGPGHVHVGGNIGGSLLTELDAIADDAWVVLELSSFMLDEMHGWSPHVAVVTNITDNHLDRHGGFDAYVKAKQTILRHQTHDDRAVLGPDVHTWRFCTPAIAVCEDEPLDLDLAVPGEHNRMNATLAVAACECAGYDRGRTMDALRDYPGLPHRLQKIAEHGGVQFYDDSKSTTADSATLALEAFEPGTVRVILGGYDKKADMRPIAAHAVDRAAGVYCIGATGEAIADTAENYARDLGRECPVYRCGDLETAVPTAIAHAEPGQVVLLSPGCASWDQFDNFITRGKRFAELVAKYAT